MVQKFDGLPDVATMYCFPPTAWVNHPFTCRTQAKVAA
jgi:hypothetical protein